MRETPTFELFDYVVQYSAGDALVWFTKTILVQVRGGRESTALAGCPKSAKINW
tara:strand:+ start:2847 stop:3008 length:162 start_codon:yes stop_codon:yes gene_type:complete